MSTKALTQYVDDQRTRIQIFKVLVSALILLSVCYIYLIGSITFNVLARKSLETNMREVGNRVSALELEHLTLSNSINTSFAHEKGFVDAQNTIFASRNDHNLALR